MNGKPVTPSPFYRVFLLPGHPACQFCLLGIFLLRAYASLQTEHSLQRMEMWRLQFWMLKLLHFSGILNASATNLVPLTHLCLSLRKNKPPCSSRMPMSKVTRRRSDGVQDHSKWENGASPRPRPFRPSRMRTYDTTNAAVSMRKMTPIPCGGSS